LQYARDREFAAADLFGGRVLCRFGDGNKVRQHGERPEQQNKCPVSDIIDLHQYILAVAAANLLQSGYPGHDAEMRKGRPNAH
jgi:hypothetical protein